MKKYNKGSMALNLFFSVGNTCSTRTTEAIGPDISFAASIKPDDLSVWISSVNESKPCDGSERIDASGKGIKPPRPNDIVSKTYAVDYTIVSCSSSYFNKDIYWCNMSF